MQLEREELSNRKIEIFIQNQELVSPWELMPPDSFYMTFKTKEYYKWLLYIATIINKIHSTHI